LARAKEVKPFAITLDIMMRERDGWDVMRELKNDPATSQLDRYGKINEVLVIDDDPAVLRLVQKMLVDAGKFRVTIAEGGIKGWQVINNQHPDGIVLDLFVPDLNGFTILDKMRSDELLKSIPVIILTGVDLTVEQHRRLSDFGNQLLTKGFLRENDLLSILGSELKKIPRG
jgi:CheY-like chemotaxis protein